MDGHRHYVPEGSENQMTYGSVVNMIYDQPQGRGGHEPAVGDPATILCWSDRHAATVTAVTRFKTGTRAGLVKSITVRPDHAQRIDTNGMSESQEYEYAPDPSRLEQTFRTNKHGRTPGLAIGFREEYYDYSF